MNSIDSLINVPLLISMGIGLLLLLFLLVMKLRKTSHSSFIFFVVVAVVIIGAGYTLISQAYINIVFTIIISEVLLLPYVILKTFDNPKKREEKLAAKKASTQQMALEQDSASKKLIAEIEAKHQRLLDVNKELISKVSTFFSNENSMESFMEYCNKFISEKVSADGCVILLADDYDNTLAVKSLAGTFPPPYKLPDDLPHKPIRVETNLRFATFNYNDNVFGDVLTSKQASLVADSVKDPRIFQNGPEDFLRCGSYIFVPIIQQEAAIGVVALSRKPDNAKFTKEDFDTAVILVDAIATSLKPLYSFLSYAESTELNKGGDIATSYQKQLLPQKLPIIPGTSIGCFSVQTENVCGDYYDVIVSRKDRISFIMADIAGKGMNALVVMTMVRAILRLAVNTPQSASTILSWANRGICSDTSKIDHFASIALINYDSVNKEAQISTCGNNPVFIYTAADKSFKQISSPTEPMGVSKETVYTDINIKLNSGDIIATCTDGLLESLNEDGVQYSTEQLSKSIIKNCNANAKDISAKVKEDFRKYCGSAQQYDDQSLLVIKIQ